MRIRINEAADGPVLGGNFGFDTAPGCAIASQHDLALDVDAQFLQLAIVVRQAIVHIDQLAGDIAIGRVGVIDGQVAFFDAAGFVAFDGRLFDLRGESGGGHHFEEARLRGGEERIKCFDGGFVAPAFELRGDEFGRGFAAWGADVVGLGR